VRAPKESEMFKRKAKRTRVCYVEWKDNLYNSAEYCF